jgi:DNA-directed RNA polymerase specialized sigma24 family protein
VNAQALFTAHRDGVFRYLTRIVGPSEASDLTQEVFLRVTRAAVPETTRDGERAWVFSIARNLALNHQRDRGRRPETVELDDAARPASQDTAVAMRQGTYAFSRYHQRLWGPATATALDPIDAQRRALPSLPLSSASLFLRLIG